MKKEIFGILLAIVFFSFVNATCNLDVSLLNQDPYPAIPGEYVDIVFQVDGVANSECNTIYFELLENYPLQFDPYTTNLITIESGTYQRKFQSFLIAPYKVRIDENALNGDTPIEIRFKHGGEGYQIKEFNLNVEDSRADFEVYIQEYDHSTKEITFEILNIAESDILSLTIEIPRQNNLEIIGSKTNIVGDLDANEYTTANFKAIPKEGEIKINLMYTDQSGARRIIEKIIVFEEDYFQPEAKTTSTSKIIISILVILLIVWFFYRRYKKKKLMKAKRR
jgi:hypothetical protein